MKTQAILLSTVGFAALATAGTANGNGMEPTTAVVTVQPIPTVIETISPTSPQPSDNASPLLAKRPDLDKRSDDDDDCVPGSIAPLDLTCEDFSEDVKCHSKSHLKHPFGDREDYYVSCIQWCRKRSGLNRYIFYKGRYLDMTLEEYDEWIRNGAESNTATAAVSTTTEPAATATVWTNLATTNQPPPSVKTGAKTTTKAVANTTSWDVKVKSTGFQTSFRTISSSAPLASSSVLLGERSTTEADCHHKAAGQQKCRTKCG